MGILEIIGIVAAVVLLGCLVALEVFLHRHFKLKKEISQDDKVIDALNKGVPAEEILKMEMPDDMRKEVENIRDKESLFK